VKSDCASLNKFVLENELTISESKSELMLFSKKQSNPDAEWSCVRREMFQAPELFVVYGEGVMGSTDVILILYKVIWSSSRVWLHCL
jgi:hypothetical protein